MEFLPLIYSLLYFFIFLGGGRTGSGTKQNTHTRARTKKERKNPPLCEPTQSCRGDKTPRREVLGVLRKLNWDFRSSDAVSRILSVSVDVRRPFIYDSLPPPKTLIKSLTKKRVSATQLVSGANEGASAVITKEAGVCRQPLAAKTHSSSILAVAKNERAQKTTVVG